MGRQKKSWTKNYLFTVYIQKLYFVNKASILVITSLVVKKRFFSPPWKSLEDLKINIFSWKYFWQDFYNFVVGRNFWRCMQKFLTGISGAKIWKYRTKCYFSLFSKFYGILPGCLKKQKYTKVFDLEGNLTCLHKLQKF